MRTILFVDDEPNILDGIRRILRPMRNEWNTIFVNSGQEALEVLEKENCDVVVSDIRMPGMNGVELLTKIKENYPSIIRIALSGYADTELLAESVRATHQFLTKPCDIETLKTTIARACSLQEMLADKDLQELVLNLESLPSMPTTYAKIMAQFQSTDGSIKEVGEIISQDMAMTAKLLQLVNSSYFGLVRQIASASEAVTYLGFDILRTLVLSMQIFEKFKENRASKTLEALHKNSLRAGALAKEIAISAGQNNKDCNFAQMAGMLQDIGVLVLLDNYPEKYTEFKRLSESKEMTLCQYEKDVFGNSHMEVGAYLLALWGLPNQIIEAVAHHHFPGKSLTDNVFSPLTAIHIANGIMHEKEPENIYAPILDNKYLANIGLKPEEPEWRDLYHSLNSEAA